MYNANTKPREIQNVQKLRNDWGILKTKRRQRNTARRKKRNIRAVWQSLNEQKPPIRKTKGLRDNGKVHLDARNKLRIST